MTLTVMILIVLEGGGRDDEERGVDSDYWRCGHSLAVDDVVFNESENRIYGQDIECNWNLRWEGGNLRGHLLGI